MLAESPTAPLDVTVVSVAHEVWGSEISILQLIPYLARRDIAVTIAAPEDGPFAAEAGRRGIRCVPLRLPAHAGVISRTSRISRSMRPATA